MTKLDNIKKFKQHSPFLFECISQNKPHLTLTQFLDEIQNTGELTKESERALLRMIDNSDSRIDNRFTSRYHGTSFFVNGIIGDIVGLITTHDADSLFRYVPGFFGLFIKDISLEQNNTLYYIPIANIIYHEFSNLPMVLNDDVDVKNNYKNRLKVIKRFDTIHLKNTKQNKQTNISILGYCPTLEQIKHPHIDTDIWYYVLKRVSILSIS